MSPDTNDFITPETLTGSIVARRVSVRLHDYLREIDASLSAYWPLAERLPQAEATGHLERLRVRVCLAWGIEIVTPAAIAFLITTFDDIRRREFATRAVQHELRRALHVAGTDHPQAWDLATSHVWAAVFAAFTAGHTQPLVPAVRPVLTSGHELLARLIDLTPDTADAALRPFTPIASIQGAA